MLVGYARVSTAKQDTALQLEALNAAGCEQIFEETASGAKADRPELAKALTFLRKGDVLVVWKLDRLARSLTQLVQVVNDLRAREVGFKCLTQEIDTTTAQGRLVFGIFASLAEFERELISERTHAGLAAARAEGKIGGRRPKLADEKIEELKRRLADGQSWRSISKDMQIAMSTISRYVRGMNDAALDRRRQEPAPRPSKNGRRKYVANPTLAAGDARRRG